MKTKYLMAVLFIIYMSSCGIFKEGSNGSSEGKNTTVADKSTDISADYFLYEGNMMNKKYKLTLENAKLINFRSSHSFTITRIDTTHSVQVVNGVLIYEDAEDRVIRHVGKDLDGTALEIATRNKKNDQIAIYYSDGTISSPPFWYEARGNDWYKLTPNARTSDGKNVIMDGDGNMYIPSTWDVYLKKLKQKKVKITKDEKKLPGLRPDGTPSPK